jgi:hypothetical protein
VELPDRAARVDPEMRLPAAPAAPAHRAAPVLQHTPVASPDI